MTIWKPTDLHSQLLCEGKRIAIIGAVPAKRQNPDEGIQLSANRSTVFKGVSIAPHYTNSYRKGTHREVNEGIQA